LGSVLAIIITADDLGLDARVNAAVLQSFGLGLITHASLIVNLDGFEDACQLLEVQRLHDRIGLHLNLTEGVPLTENIKRTRLCVDGRFVALDRVRYYQLMSSATRRAVANEVAAQIAAARRAGIALTHLDSHNDVHTAPSLAGVVAAMARTHGIPRVRPGRNCGPIQGVIRWMHHRRYNQRLERLGLKHVKYFGTIDDLIWLCDRYPAERVIPAEVMTHPRLSSGDVVIDAPGRTPLAERVKELEKRSFSQWRPQTTTPTSAAKAAAGSSG
jgi:hypothetical protein